MKLGAMQTDKQKLVIIKEILSIPSDLEYREHLLSNRPATKFSGPLQALSKARVKYLNQVRIERIDKAQEWFCSAYDQILTSINNKDTNQLVKIQASFLIMILYYGQIPRLYDLISNPEAVKKRYDIKKSKFIDSTKNIIENHTMMKSEINLKRTTLMDIFPEGMPPVIKATLKTLDESFNAEVDILVEQERKLKLAKGTYATDKKRFRLILTPFIILFKLCKPIPIQRDQINELVKLFKILGYDDSVQLHGIIGQWYGDAVDAYVTPLTEKFVDTISKHKTLLK